MHEQISMFAEPKPCYHCGRRPVVGRTPGGDWQIECQHCRFQMMYGYPDREKMIAAWNEEQADMMGSCLARKNGKEGEGFGG